MKPTLIERLRGHAIDLEPKDGATPSRRPDKLVHEAADRLEKCEKALQSILAVKNLAPGWASGPSQMIDQMWDIAREALK